MAQATSSLLRNRGMPVRSRWPLAALALSLTLVLIAPVPARAQVCDLLNQLGACTPSEQELEFTTDGLIVLPGAPSSAPSAPPPPSSPRLLPDAARRLLDLANQERTRVGAPTLVFRDDVVQLAIAHTQKMVGGGGIFHNLDLLTKPLLSTLGALAVGENVGWSTHLEDLHPRLMASAAHRAAMLDPRFTVAGFAVIQDTDGRYYVTQDFIQPSGVTPPPPSPSPAPPPPAVAGNEAPVPARAPGSAVAPERAAPEAAVDSPGGLDEDEVPIGLVETGTEIDQSGLDASELAQGEVAGIIVEPASTTSSGRAGLVLVALALLSAAILGQGWWWTLGRRATAS